MNYDGHDGAETLAEGLGGSYSVCPVESPQSSRHPQVWSMCCQHRQQWYIKQPLERQVLPGAESNRSEECDTAWLQTRGRPVGHWEWRSRRGLAWHLKISVMALQVQWGCL